jgi:antitoxin component YwqK of YwqJK toxin-antitoxin module
MKFEVTLKSVFALACICLTCGCSFPTSSGSDSREGASSVVTSQWSDGSPRRKAEVINGDTVSISLFDSSGQLTKYGEWENSERHGSSRAFYPNGLPWSEHTYEHGTQVGDYKTWHPNGNLFIKGQYDLLGKPHGTWQFFNETGELIQEQQGDSIQP